jgi:hypothetical protein
MTEFKGKRKRGLTLTTKKLSKKVVPNRCGNPFERIKYFEIERNFLNKLGVRRKKLQ